jgi:hypothetical protein
MKSLIRRAGVWLARLDRRRAAHWVVLRAIPRAMVGSDDLILLACGVSSWPKLLSSGRFQLSGDPFLALRFASLFKLPVRRDAV